MKKPTARAAATATRILIATTVVWFPLVTESLAQFSQPYDPEGLSSRPRRSESSGADDWTVSKRPSEKVSDLVPEYLKTVPRCPAFGWYTINPEGMDPECSFPGHKIDAQGWMVQ